MIDILKSHKTVFIVWICYKKSTIWKRRLCFISEVACSVLSVSELSRCIFHCGKTWCVAWERHGLSDIATVTKGGMSLWRVNCTRWATKLVYYIRKAKELVMWSKCQKALLYKSGARVKEFWTKTTLEESREYALCTPNCKSLWIKASAKWLNVSVNVKTFCKEPCKKCLLLIIVYLIIIYEKMNENCWCFNATSEHFSWTLQWIVCIDKFFGI